MSARKVADESWAEVAAATRDALALLGWPIDSRCLPGEPQHADCGHSHADHALAHLTLIGEIARHQLDHLGPPRDIRAMLAADARAKLRRDCRQGVHQ